MYLRRYVVAAAENVAENARAASAATAVALADAASDNIGNVIADVRHLLHNPNVVGLLPPAVVGVYDDWLGKALATGNAMRCFEALKGSGFGDGTPMDQGDDSGAGTDAEALKLAEAQDKWRVALPVLQAVSNAIAGLLSPLDDGIAMVDPTRLEDLHRALAEAVPHLRSVSTDFAPLFAPVPDEILLRAAVADVTTVAALLNTVIFPAMIEKIDAALGGQTGATLMDVDEVVVMVAGDSSGAVLDQDVIFANDEANKRVNKVFHDAGERVAQRTAYSAAVAQETKISRAGEWFNVHGLIDSLVDMLIPIRARVEVAEAKDNLTAATKKATVHPEVFTRKFSLHTRSRYVSRSDHLLLLKITKQYNVYKAMEEPLWANYMDKCNELIASQFPHGNPGLMPNSAKNVDFSFIRETLPGYFNGGPKSSGGAGGDDSEYKPFTAATTSMIGAPLHFIRLLLAEIRKVQLYHHNAGEAVPKTDEELAKLYPNFEYNTFVPYYSAPVSDSVVEAPFVSQAVGSYPPEEAKLAILDAIYVYRDLPVQDEKVLTLLAKLEELLENGKMTAAEVVAQYTADNLPLSVPEEALTMEHINHFGLHPLVTLTQYAKVISVAAGIWTAGNDHHELARKVAMLAKISPAVLQAGADNGRAFVDAILLANPKLDKELKDRPMEVMPNTLLLLGGDAFQHHISAFATHQATDKYNAVVKAAANFGRVIEMVLRDFITPAAAAYCRENKRTMGSVLGDTSAKGRKILEEIGMLQAVLSVQHLITRIDENISPTIARDSMFYAEAIMSIVPLAVYTPPVDGAAMAVDPAAVDLNFTFEDVTPELLARVREVVETTVCEVPNAYAYRHKEPMSTTPEVRAKMRFVPMDFHTMYHLLLYARARPVLVEKGRFPPLTPKTKLTVGYHASGDIGEAGASVSRQYILNCFAGSAAGNLASNFTSDATSCIFKYPMLHVSNQTKASPRFNVRTAAFPPPLVQQEEGWERQFDGEFWLWGSKILPLILQGGEEGQVLSDKLHISLLRRMGVKDHFIFASGGLVDVQSLWPAFRDSQTQACPPEHLASHKALTDWIAANIFYLACDCGFKNPVAVVDTTRAMNNFTKVNEANAAHVPESGPRPTGPLYGATTVLKLYNQNKSNASSMVHTVHMPVAQFAQLRVVVVQRLNDTQFGPSVVNDPNGLLPPFAHILHVNEKSVLNRFNPSAVLEQWNNAMTQTPLGGEVMVRYFFMSDATKNIAPRGVIDTPNLVVKQNNVLHYRQTKLHRTKAFAEGTVPWSDEHFAAVKGEQAAAAALVDSLTNQLMPGGLAPDSRAAARVQTQLQEAQKDHTRLTAAITTQENVRTINTARRDVAEHRRGGASIADARAKAFNAAFDAHAAVLNLEDPWLRNADAARLKQSANQKVADAVVSHAYSAAALRGPVHFAPIIIVGDGNASGGCIDLKRVWQLVSRFCLVFYNASEFRSTHLGLCCGGAMHHPPAGKARGVGRAAKGFKGTLQCGDRNCASQGRFQHRDLMAAANIACIFVCSFVLGGSLGGFSRCQALGADGQLVDPSKRLSMLRLFTGGLRAGQVKGK